jgi:hypothetical protein
MNICCVIRRDILLGRNIVDEMFHLSTRQLSFPSCELPELPQSVLELSEHPNDISVFKAFLAYLKIGGADGGSV